MFKKKIEILFPYSFYCNRQPPTSEIKLIMASSIDMTVLPVSVPSLCIPRVFQNITKQRVAYVFKSLGLGEIDHIDMILKTSENGDKFQRVFIHFKRWYTTDDAVRARERVLGGKEIKVIYDDPWFWKISANRYTHRSSSGQASSRTPASRPRIVDESASSDNDDNLLSAKSSSQHHRAGVRRPKNDRRDSTKADIVVDHVPRELLPEYPRDPTPTDEGGPWIKVDYGDASSSKPTKRRMVIKKPKLQEQEPGEL